MKLQEKLKEHHGTTVLREWDHGSSSDFWLVPMTGSQLEEWWSAQQTFDDNPPSKNEMLDVLAKVFNEPRPKERIWTFKWPGRRLMAKTNPARQLWMNLYESKKYYSCHVCCDEESYLETPEGHRLYHKGHGRGTPNQAL